MSATRGYRCLLLPLALSTLGLSACGSLPSLEGRTVTTALSAAQAQATLLGQAVQPRLAAHPDRSGLYPLDDPLAAFAARVLLARRAERTLDAQYYIWQNDITGTMLLAELERAAKRGVRVRLLLDDNGIRGALDDTLAALAAEPNFEVRLFNPFTWRHPKWANYITAFSRLNHRMHNKSFTVDDQASIIGGRNIGDTYFGATDGILFSDLDVLAIGPVVSQVSVEFDRYWASDLAYPIGRIVRNPDSAALAGFHAREARLVNDPAASSYRQALGKDLAVRSLSKETLALTWAHTRMLSDPPEKAFGRIAPGEGLIDGLAQVFATTTKSLELVSPYLVLRASGTRDLAAMAARGVEVSVLTNSLAATDTAAVHAGYAKRRKQLLAAGIKLYEWPPTGGNPSERKLAGAFGSSGSSLHAKTFAVDGQQLFIGSFNFDPRSAHLNTEMGFLIESPTLAQAMHVAFAQDIPHRAYQVSLDAKGQLQWLRWENGKLRRYDSEPGSSWLRRASVRLLSVLPIEWLL